MALPVLNRQELEKALAAVGVQKGDGLLVHSALQFLGKPEGGEDMYLETLFDVLGPEGTIAVPTFNFAFARGEDFDRLATASEGMGVFSELVRLHTKAHRTRHPMQSLALIGALAEDLAERNTPSAFDDGSAFDGLLQNEFKLLLLGADIQAASMLHYSEQRAAVPYRYWKDFKGKVRFDDKWQLATYKMFVRDLDIDPQLILAPIQAALEDAGQWAQESLTFGHISLCTLADFVAATDRLLAEDPWAIVSNRAELKL
jgi:aminoglycoside N3'-acetyltransferase